MSFTTRRLGANRLVIYDLLKRTREYHAPILGLFEWDVTDTLARIQRLRDDGVRVNLAALLVKATAQVVRKHERLRTRMFFGLRGPREVTFEEVSCNLVVHRDGPEGELLFPIVLREADTRDILDIAATIRRYKTAPLDSLDEVRAMRGLNRVPRVLTKLHDYKVRTDPKYFIERYGTYGLSAVVHSGSGLVGAIGPSPGTAFFASTLDERPHVHDGQVVPRMMLSIGINGDHQVVDGLHGVRTGRDLKVLLEQPEHLLGHL